MFLTQRIQDVKLVDRTKKKADSENRNEHYYLGCRRIPKPAQLRRHHLEDTPELNPSQDMLDRSLRYIANGLAVIPLHPNTKLPALIGWTTAPFPTEKKCHEWFGKGTGGTGGTGSLPAGQAPGYNIGIRTGRVSGIFVVDIDIRDGGMATWMTLQKDYVFNGSEKAAVVTPSGGLHIYYRLPVDPVTGLTIAIKTCAGQLGPGVDLRGEGGQVAAPPSVIDGIAYRPATKRDPSREGSLWDMINYPEQSLIDLILSKTSKNPYSVDGTDPIAEGQRNTTLVSFCGVLKERGLDYDTIHARLAEINAKRCHPPLGDKEIETIAGRAKGWTTPDHVGAATPGMQELRRNKSGIADGAMSNISRVLLGDHRVSGIFRYNDLYEDCFIVKEPPWGGKINRACVKNDEIQLKNWLTSESGHRMTDPTVQHIYEAIRNESLRNKYHPVKDWLYSLKWDGVPRVQSFCSAVFGVVGDEDYYKGVSRMLLYGSTARALYPGCKFDHMIVLVGKQGIGKSLFVHRMYEPWDGELMTDISKYEEVCIQLKGLWGVEFPELNRMGKHPDALKALISSPSDNYRAKYERNAVKALRGWIPIGTTNDDEYLSDITGGRRYLTIKCGDRPVNFWYVKEYRELVFAEAVRVVKNAGEENVGSLWTELGDGFNKANEVMQESVRYKDVWEEEITEWCRGKLAVTTKRILAECLQVPNTQAGGAVGRKIAAILRKIGFERDKDTSNREWVNIRLSRLSVIRNEEFKDGIKELGSGFRRDKGKDKYENEDDRDN